jgi:ketosteroid isomerase-like protein
MKQVCALIVVMTVGMTLGACGKASKGANIASSATVGPSASGTTSTSTTTSPHAPSAQARAITEFGHKASPADRQAITALVKRYYAAAASDDGATACSLIYSTIAESVAEDYGQAPAPASLSGNTCEVVMSKLFRQVPQQPSAVLATTEVTGVRVNGRKGYALLRSKTIPAGDIPLQRELGTWRIGTLIGSALPGTEAADLAISASSGPKAIAKPHFDEPGVPLVKDANDGEDDPASNDDEPVIDFGHAASAADQKAIALLIRRFYTATSAADGRAICSLVYDVVAETIPEKYEQAPGLKGKTCAEVMSKVFAPLRRQTERDRRKLKVTRVRVEGPRGLVMVYLGKRPEPYFLVHRQGAAWKMQRLSITTLP